MKGVAVTGLKGGTGKTALSHALALGAAWKRVPAYLCHTDNREPLRVKGRPYAYYDARSPETLATLAQEALNGDGLFIVDGGGNRPAFDNWIASAMDMVLIPVSPDPEDVQEGLRQAELMDKAGAGKIRFIINKYPGHKNERMAVQRYLDPIPEEMILGKVNEAKAIRSLRESDPEEGFQTPVTRVNNLSRSFYFLVNSELA